MFQGLFWGEFVRVLLVIFLFVSTSALAEKTFVYCSEAGPSTFNPQMGADGPTFNASSEMLFNRLVEFEYGTTKVIPALAESWEISKTGKVYTFHLRKDVWFQTTETFKPTRPMNADDVLFSFNRMRSKTHPFHKVSGGVYEYFQSMGLGDLIEDIVKVDENTVRFTLSHAESPFLADLALSFAVVQSKEYGDQLVKSKSLTKMDNEPVGTGPFILKRYVKDNVIRYDANPKYFRGVPKIQKVVFLITPDASVRFQKLKAGECHLIAEPAPTDLKIMKTMTNLAVITAPGANIGYLAINVKKKPFDNLKVRQALSHAFNIPNYLNVIYQGAAIQAKGAIPPTVPGYDEKMPGYDYDVEKAKALLKEAGFPEGFETEIWTLPVQRPYLPNGKKMGELMQADLAKIGIKAKLVTYDWPTYLDKTRKGEHALAQLGWVTDNGDPDNFLDVLLSCHSVHGGSNISQWCYQPFDQLIQKAKLISEMPERVKLYSKAQEMVRAQVPWVPIAHATMFRGISKKVIGYKISPVGSEDFADVDLP
jgi:dipeptide transport system substrate-binding protein